MTDKSPPSVQDDIAYIKAIAAEGRSKPLTGGSILVAAGSIFGLASLAHYSIMEGLIVAPLSATSWIWLTAMIVFAAALILLIRHIGRNETTRTAANRANATAWMAVGLSIFVMSLAIAAISWRTQSDAVVAVFPSLILTLYGCGWAVAAEMSGVKWFWRLTIGAWIGAPILGLLTGTTEQYLAYGVAILLLTLLPGLAMMKAVRDHG